MNLQENFIKEVLRTSAWKSASLDVDLKKETDVIDESSEVDEEEEETQAVCPLCESELESELSDQCLLEHASEMLSLFDEVENLLTEDEDAEDEDVEDEEDEEADEKED